MVSSVPPVWGGAMGGFSLQLLAGLFIPGFIDKLCQLLQLIIFTTCVAY